MRRRRTTAHENRAFYDISCISSDFQGSILQEEGRSRLQMSSFLLAWVSFSLALVRDYQNTPSCFLPQKEMHILLCLPGGNHIHHMINKSINGTWVRYLGGLHILHEPIGKGVGE